MSLVIPALAAIVALTVAGLYACLAATVWHFRRGPGAPRPGAAAILPMTLIKPVRGLDDAMREGFESVVESDPEGRLQLIIALEDEGDPACQVARDFARAHPERDILVLVAGPAGGRMGKVHNMIAALARAKHPYVIFADADTLATPGLVRRTSAAFGEGFEAVYALPRHGASGGFGGWEFQVAFNHSFGLAAALCYYATGFCFSAGAWMAYTKELIERAGGLEQFEHAIADDIALGTKASAVGARRILLGEPVRVRETGAAEWREASAHLAKWAAIVRACYPRLYLFYPLWNLGVLPLLLWALCERSHRAVWLGRGLLAAAAVSRVLVGWAQDRWIDNARMPPWEYLSLAFIDLGSLAFWASGFRSRIEWRGTVYRLAPGGRAEVLSRAPLAG